MSPIAMDIPGPPRAKTVCSRRGVAGSRLQGSPILIACNYEFTKQWDNIPGGSQVANKSDGTTGSLTGTFNHPDYGDEIITAGHVAGDNGTTMEQSADVIGTARDVYNDNLDIDYAFIEMTSDESVTSWIANSTNESLEYQIKGGLTNETLEYHVGDESYTMYTQGRTTCRQSGYITGTFSAPGTNTSAVGVSQGCRDGDSGGALFHINSSDEALIGGNIIQIYDDDDGTKNTKSTTAEKVESDMNGYYY